MATKKSDAAEAVVEMLDEPIVEETIPEEELETVIFEPVVEEKFSIRALPGDNYLTIAEKYLPKNDSVKRFAEELFALNNGTPIRPGTRVVIR